MKRVRRVIAMLLALMMAVGMLAGCGGEAEEEGNDAGVPEVTIACGWSSIGEQELLQQQYYEEVLGPELGIKFIFSPVLSSDEEIIDFLENASAQGAVGFMDMASSSNDSANIVAEKCDELEMYVASWMTAVNVESDYVVGMASADGFSMSGAFNEMLLGDLQDDGETHSMLIFSYGAQYGIPKHLYTTMGALSAFNEMYGLGWTEEEMTSFATSKERLYVDTGREDVKVCIEPSMANDQLNEICAEDLKNGDYDVLVASDSFYLKITTAIAEAEQALGKNIHVYCNSNIVSATQAAFDTTDPFGNPSLDQAMLKSSANGVVIMALLLNGVYGDMDAIRDADGSYKLYNIRFMRASSAEDYARIAQIDHDGKWMFSIDVFKQMLKAFNEDVSYEWLQEYINENVTFASVMERLGL